MKISLRRLAEKDLASLLRVFREQPVGPGVEDRFFDAFEDTCSLISRFPNLGRREDPDVPAIQTREDLRSIQVRSFPKYLVIYVVHQDEIVIRRILHAARDPKLRLTDPS